MPATKSSRLEEAFTEREYVDMPRACRILGASWTMVNRMCASGFLTLIDFRERGRKRVHYGSIVEHCNRLREEYAIPDRRPKLTSKLLRYRDEDILPFPFSETICAGEAADLLGYRYKECIWRYCEEGRFEGYRLHPGAPWRISAPSLRAYLSQIKKGVHGGLAAYKFTHDTLVRSAFTTERTRCPKGETKTMTAAAGKSSE